MNDSVKTSQRAARRSGTSGFAQRLAGEWWRLRSQAGLEPHDGVEPHARVVVAVSGGADSVALLAALDELIKTGRERLELFVAHLDHGLRGEAALEDARWVEALAGNLGYAVEVGRASLKASAPLGNLEQEARRARYEFLHSVALRHGAACVLTGHTLDDQAETVLLRFMRGSGADGLGGMEVVRAIAEGSDIQLVRPLVTWARRVETERYCRARGLEYRADAMNEDESFSRVRVRRQLLPLMRTFNPRVVESLARAADLLREDAAFLNDAAEELLREAGSGAEDAPEGSAQKGHRSPSVLGSLSVDVMARAHAAVRRRALRLWLARGRGDLRRLELVHLSGVERLLAGERGGRVAELPGGSSVLRRRGRLWFVERQGPGARGQGPEEKRAGE